MHKGEVMMHRYALAEPKSSAVFRKLLKQFRSRRDWSQEQLAQQANMDHSLVSRIESGARTPTRIATHKLAKGLELRGLERDQLLIAAGYFPGNPAHAVVDQPVVALLYEFLNDRRFSETRRRELAEQVAALIAVATASLS
jgi:transcriptional regulator with XRE-family HTH domain